MFEGSQASPAVFLTRVVLKSSYLAENTMYFQQNTIIASVLYGTDGFIVREVEKKLNYVIRTKFGNFTVKPGTPYCTE